MKKLNAEFDGALDKAIQIFTNQYPKKFLHQLISSQLDLDRLDYLRRDSFFTGVSEGTVGINRILKTMRVFKGNIVIERKGIYAVENYIIARRLMYMQVYLHKTVLSADMLLRSIFRRVRTLLDEEVSIPQPSAPLSYFLEQQPSAKKMLSREVIDRYTAMDDHDVYVSIKAWSNSDDKTLSDLCQRFLNRNLFRTSFLDKKPDKKLRQKLVDLTKKHLKTANLPCDDNTVMH